MRGLFILLLLSNIGFIAWQYVQEDKQQNVSDIYRGINMVNNGLTMLSELPPELQPALRDATNEDVADEHAPNHDKQKASADDLGATRAETKVSAEALALALDKVETTDTGCFRIKGIEGRPALLQLVTLLKDNGATMIKQEELQGKKTHYQVMLPPYPNRAKADEAAAILSGKRVKDFFIVRSGEYQNAVSLGVFSTRERAEHRAQQIIALKARLRRPRIEVIEAPATKFVVNYSLEDKMRQEELEKQLNRLKYPSSEKISCR